ncbi:MAG: NAD(P)-binding protein [Chloroflexia bacterium]
MALERHNRPFIVIEQDHRRVEELRARDIDAIYGDAATPALLEHANLGGASVLVVATDEALVTRQIVEHARHDRPDLPIIARTHSWDELQALRKAGVETVIMGELELALEMADHALRRCGVPDDAARRPARSPATCGVTAPRVRSPLDSATPLPA